MELNLLSYVNENMLMLIPVLYVLGIFMKKSRIRDNLIPWFLLIGACILVGITTRDIIQSIIQGTLVTGVCVLGSQLYIQTVRKREE